MSKKGKGKFSNTYEGKTFVKPPPRTTKDCKYCRF